MLYRKGRIVAGADKELRKEILQQLDLIKLARKVISKCPSADQDGISNETIKSVMNHLESKSSLQQDFLPISG